MILNLVPCCVLASVIILSGFLWMKLSQVTKHDQIGYWSGVQDLKTLRGQHETATALLEMVVENGAGSWPPKADHNGWPPQLRPYKGIYLNLIPLLAVAEPSLDDNVNSQRISNFRSMMSKLLNEHVNYGQIKNIMEAAKEGSCKDFPRDAYNGFYACIACSRHAYR